MSETKYVHAELGLLPSDWTIARWGDVLSTFATGATPYRGNKNYYKGNICWITNGELNYNTITDTLEHISECAVKETNLTIYPKGTFLMAITGLEAEGTRGKCAFVGKPSATNQSYLAINASSIVCTEYLYWFYRMYGELLAFKFSQGTKQQSYTAKIVQQLPIGFPTMKEQQRIASALTAVDNLLSSLDRLIAKKKDIKQATMQQLLTKGKRLPGFNDEWKEFMLGEIGDTYNGITGKSAKDFEHGKAKYITFLNVLNNTKINPSIFESVDIKDSEKQNAVKYGDLFFNTSSETPEEVGMCSALMEDANNTYLNSFCFGFRLYDISKVSSLYLAYWFRTSQGRFLMGMLAQGSTRYNLSKEGFKKGCISMPSYDEQCAIVTVLSSMDSEIAALEHKREKIERIKQGMMQQLLTGKIRLV